MKPKASRIVLGHVGLARATSPDFATKLPACRFATAFVSFPPPSFLLSSSSFTTPRTPARMALKLADLLNPTSRPTSPAPRPPTLTIADHGASLQDLAQQSEGDLPSIAASQPTADTVETTTEATAQDDSEALAAPGESKGDNWDDNDLAAAQVVR